ncbi:hypothetical protein IAT40_000393 [Kwoniella sp. CBS 6097]
MPSPSPSELRISTPTPTGGALPPNITRSASSPLSSPSSTAAAKPLPEDITHTLEAGDGGIGGIDEEIGEMRSPATSSTLPLTDDEEDDGDDGQGGDDESELTEEDETKGDRDMDMDIDMDNDMDAELDTRMDREHAQDEPIEVDEKPLIVHNNGSTSKRATANIPRGSS